jgi:hypothetical protein
MHQRRDACSAEGMIPRSGPTECVKDCSARTDERTIRSDNQTEKQSSTSARIESFIGAFNDRRPEIESTSVFKKYTILTKDLGLTSDSSRRPHQTLRGLFNFRNAIAHGKSVVLEVHERLDGPSTISSRDPRLPKPHWEEYCTLPNATRALADGSEIVAVLHRVAGLGEHPFFQHTIGMSILVVQDDVDKTSASPAGIMGSPDQPT